MNVLSLTSQQIEAISYENSMVITACPGSGKTTVIKEKIRNITRTLPEHKGVISITFTKKASYELERRCKAEAHDTKRSFFGTIDSFCLKEIIIPFLPKIWGGSPSECKIVKKLNPPYDNYIQYDFVGNPSVFNLNKDKGYKKLYDEGILWMGEFSALALKILNESSASRRYLKARYSHIFIDEYQDSSLSQHQLFVKINEIGLVSVAVGDVWQSIYEFRGGNSKLLQELVCNVDEFKHFEIDLNHRCHPSIINYASRLLDQNYCLLPTPSINVFRRRLDGNLKDIAGIVSTWITEWIDKGSWGLEKANQIVLLARKEKSLELLCSGLNIDFRFFTDTPLDKIETECSELYKEILSYKYGATGTAQELINKIFDGLIIKDSQILLFRKIIKTLRQDLTNSELIEKIHLIAGLLDFNATEQDDNALLEVLSKDIFMKQFRPLCDDEIQVMTLHKAKGLEFKVVFHFDLDEWSFPFRKINDADRYSPLYPNLQQELNLHYVGITRAETCCVLINSEFRQNASGEFKKSEESYFFKLPQLYGLYD
nr:ATP-dependent helicase [Salmonella enterica]